MFPLTQQFFPSVLKDQFETQLSFFTEFSRQMLEGMEKINKLNVQVAASVFEEVVSSTQQLLGAAGPDAGRSASPVQFEPAADRVRAYQEEVAKVFADTHSDLAKTIEAHRPVSALVTEAIDSSVTEQVFEETQQAEQHKKH